MAVLTGGVKRIGILLFPGVEELDAVGPWEILSCWTKYFPGDGFEVFTFSADGEPVECAKGMTISPQHDFGAAPGREVLVYPGGRGARALVEEPGHLAWVREQRVTTPLIASVCTGSLVLAAAGLLAGRPATTHGVQWTGSRRWIRRSRSVRVIDTSMTVTSSPPQGFPLASTWLCVSSSGWPGRDGRARSGGSSSTTRNLPPTRNGVRPTMMQTPVDAERRPNAAIQPPPVGTGLNHKKPRLPWAGICPRGEAPDHVGSRFETTPPQSHTPRSADGATLYGTLSRCAGKSSLPG
ncbi:DJ-1/PfpI family protein [Nocardia xishanensis]|uniref:DJ-1/PfpI family protein n=1 Tax=Nocardia xishanensis TaxID=238964 RepID=UPI0033DA3667